VSSEDGTRPRGIDELPAPLTFGGLLMFSWQVFTSTFVSLFGVLFGMFLIFTLFVFSIEVASGSSVSGEFSVLLTVGSLVFFGSFGVAFAAVATADSIAGQPVSVGSMIRGARSMIKEIIASSLLAVMIGLMTIVLLLFLPTLFLLLFFGPPLVMQMIVIERVRLQVAFPRARGLVRGSWLRTLGYLLCVALGLRVLQSLALDTLSRLSSQLVEPAEIIVSVVGATTIVSVITGYFAVFAAVVYFDLRARKEEYGPEQLRADRAQEA
jgi:hypothetical protein